MENGVVEMSRPMRDLAARARLESVTSADLPPRDQDVLAAGWTTAADGAWLLEAMRPRYRGRRSAFVDLTSWEAAVNGRAIYDLDLPDVADELAVALLRRGLALVRAVLELDRPGLRRPRITGAVEVSMSDTDEPRWSGSSWFWSEHDGERPYFVMDDSTEPSPLMMITR